MDQTDKDRKKKKSVVMPAVSRQSSALLRNTSAPTGDVNGTLLLVSVLPPMRRRTFFRLRGSVLTLHRHADSDARNRYVLLDAEIREHLGLLLSLRLQIAVPPPPGQPATVHIASTKRPSRVRRRRTLMLAASTPEDKSRWLAALRRASKFRLETRYTLARPIAEGLYGTVHPAVDKQTPVTTPIAAPDAPISSQHTLDAPRHASALAPLVVPRKPSHRPDDQSHVVALLAARIARPLDAPSSTRLDAAVAALHALPAHPRVLPVSHVFETHTEVAVVSEAPPANATLHAAVCARGRLCEEAARAVVADVLAALAHMHGCGVAHGFVSTRAVLVETDARGASLGGLGAGLALCGGGSGDVCAPERVSGACAAADAAAVSAAGGRSGATTGVPRTDEPVDTADVWDVGALAVRALTGRAPKFDDEGAALLTVGPEWAGVSYEARRFVRMMMTRDAEARLTAVGAQCHTWVTGASVPFAERDTVGYSAACEARHGGTRPGAEKTTDARADMVGDVVAGVCSVQHVMVARTSGESVRDAGNRSAKELGLDVRDALRLARHMTRRVWESGDEGGHGGGDEAAGNGATDGAGDWAAELQERREWRDNGVPSDQLGRVKMARGGMTEEEVSELWEHNSPTGDVVDLLEVVTR